MKNTVYKVTIAKETVKELDQIFDYYAGTKHSIKLNAELVKQIDLLSNYPNSGQQFGRYRKAVIMKRYILVYAVIGQEVRIAHVYDGRTDYQKKLQEGE